MDYKSPIAGFGRAGKKGVSYLVTRDIITKTRGAQRTIQDTHTKVRVPPFLPRQHSKFPQTHLGEKGEKQKSKKDCPHFS